MKTSFKILCVLLIGNMFCSIFIQTISEKDDRGKRSFREVIVGLINHFFDQHAKDLYAQSGVHVVDANGGIVGIYLDSQNVQYKVYDLFTGLIYLVDPWTGEPSHIGTTYKYFTNPYCLRGDNEGPFFFHRTPEEVFKKYGPDPQAFIINGQPETRGILSRQRPGEGCTQYGTPQDKPVVPRSSLREVTLPEPFPAPLHLETN